ncbi:MAG: DUF1574 family protein [Cyanobacteria bacterium P01_A01_bin.45]
MNTVLLNSPQSLEQWVSQATGINSVGVRVRLRGNDLHILCEAPECPKRWQTLSDLLKALQQTDLDALTSHGKPAVYQVFVYGRTKSEKRPQWCHRVFLNQLDKHLEEVERALLESSNRIDSSGGAIIVSNESLARKGNPDAIARYLSETLSTLGVSVEVQVKRQQPSNNNPQGENRLWIFCQSHYTPDPSLIAQPIARKLRDLNLSGYTDAVIASKVVGESTADWLLRIDLTPTEVMLKQWARWGDVQSISRLISLELPSNVRVNASLKESTLHIFCTPKGNSVQNSASNSASEDVPNKERCLESIVSLLESLAPQSILAATIYGQTVHKAEPAWIDWLSLPAAEHQALAISAMDLAISGDEPALLFLLERLLNPNLDMRLATGGIRVMLLRKEDLLHVMCDAPVCPSRKKVVSKLMGFLRQLNISGIAGVRVYGRRAGNKEPFWQYGDDFQERQKMVPEATPEFAATSAYIQELLPARESEPVLRPDLSPEEVHTFVNNLTVSWGRRIKKYLLSSHVFVEKDNLRSDFTSGNYTLGNESSQKFLTASIWFALGLILTIQSDWILGQIISNNPIKSTQKITRNLSDNTNNENDRDNNASPRKENGQTSSKNNQEAFNSSGFTQNSKRKSKATATAILLAARSPLPSFNSRQLDEQLALYKQRLLTNKKAPEVLIIGSSRALRGVDPVALSKALASGGYKDVDVFNFGINGATAQVVDFIVRQVLKSSELPKLIIWADGARAFNSGREDLTFNTIMSSPGYKKVGALSETQNNSNPEKNKDNQKSTPSQSNGYELVNDSLNQILANFSATYKQREKFKALLSNQLNYLPQPDSSPREKENKDQELNISEFAVDFDGFLPLSIRFDPQTYYQNHPKVSGIYDKDYQDFQLEGRQIDALQGLLEFTSTKKIPLVFVNMPLSADYLDPVRTEHEEVFKNYMQGLAVDSNLIFRDLSLLFPQTNDYFSDPSHLNRYGAYEVSKKIANDPMIPWTEK